MARTSLVTDRAAKVLEDGQWHDREWTVNEIMKGVPPNLAVRAAEARRDMNYRTRHKLPPGTKVPPRAVPEDIDVLIRRGARYLSQKALNNDMFEHAMIASTGQKLVRLRPEESMPESEELVKYKVEPEWKKLSPEERSKIRSERVKKAFHTRLRQQGIDPDTYVSKREMEERKRAEWNALSDEEKARRNRERVLKGIATRRRKAEQEQGDRPNRSLPDSPQEDGGGR